MNQEKAHWGDLDDRGSGEDSSCDMEDLLYPQPPRPSAPVMHQPSQEETSSFQILPPELCKSDPVVLQTIRLLQHQRKILQLIGRVQTIGTDGGNLPPCPAPPLDPQLEKPSNKHHYLNFLPPEVTPFTCVRKENQKLEIEGSTARLILRKAIATICAHVGFTDTTESVLKVLTDITHEFLSKFTHVLRSNTDTMLVTGNTPFHDVVEQSLHDVGMGSMSDLHSMYKDRVVGYYNKVRQKTLQLHQHYQVNLSRPTKTQAPSQRKDSKEWWSEEGSQPSTSGVVSSHEPTVSLKSVTSIEAENAFNALTAGHQTSVEEEVQRSPSTTQYHVYPVTPS